MSDMPLQVLLGILPSPAISASIAALAGGAASHVRDFRPEPAAALHLSLLAFPPLDPLMLPNLQGWCQLALRNVRPFALAGAQLAWAPTNTAPRMLWLQYQQHPDWLALYRQLNHNLLALMPHHRFRPRVLPHITLGRFPAQKPQKPLPKWPGPDSLAVEQLCLWDAGQAQPAPLLTVSLI